MTAMSRMLTADGVLAAIGELGDTPEAIHDALRVRGVRGERGCEVGCPLAVYLMLVFTPSAATVHVDCDTVEVITHDGCSVYVDLRPAAVNFVYQHDIGAYPDLQLELMPGSGRLPSHV